MQNVDKLVWGNLIAHDISVSCNWGRLFILVGSCAASNGKHVFNVHITPWMFIIRNQTHVHLIPTMHGS